MDKLQAITVWTDESEFEISSDSYCLIGQLITNSDTEEFSFLNKLKQARKKIRCWNTLHGNELKGSDKGRIALLKEWISIYKNDESVYFHVFLYKKNAEWTSKHQTPEHYFANQCYFGLGNRMRQEGIYIRTMFSEVGTITALFDRRRAHEAHISPTTRSRYVIERMNSLEEVYEKKIKNQLCNLSGKSADDLTLRFSFLSSVCFDALQLCDCLLYISRARLLKERLNEDTIFSKIWDDFFLDDLHFEISDYSDEPQYNFFESTR